MNGTQLTYRDFKIIKSGSIKKLTTSKCNVKTSHFERKQLIKLVYFYRILFLQIHHQKY